MCKNSVYFSALPVSVSSPSLRLLWRRHCPNGVGLPNTIYHHVVIVIDPKKTYPKLYDAGSSVKN